MSSEYYSNRAFLQLVGSNQKYMIAFTESVSNNVEPRTPYWWPYCFSPLNDAFEKPLLCSRYFDEGLSYGGNGKSLSSRQAMSLWNDAYTNARVASGVFVLRFDAFTRESQGFDEKFRVMALAALEADIKLREYDENVFNLSDPLHVDVIAASVSFGDQSVPGKFTRHEIFGSLAKRAPFYDFDGMPIEAKESTSRIVRAENFLGENLLVNLRVTLTSDQPDYKVCNYCVIGKDGSILSTDALSWMCSNGGLSAIQKDYRSGPRIAEAFRCAVGDAMIINDSDFELIVDEKFLANASPTAKPPSRCVDTKGMVLFVGDFNSEVHVFRDSELGLLAKAKSLYTALQNVELLNLKIHAPFALSQARVQESLF
jgi:hypothetical protein